MGDIHCFDVRIAEICGVNSAIILHRYRYHTKVCFSQAESILLRDNGKYSQKGSF